MEFPTSVGVEVEAAQAWRHNEGDARSIMRAFAGAKWRGYLREPSIRC